jgi:Fe-S cluster biosynthesis and repair protein YggX
MPQVQCVTCGQSGDAITDTLFMGRLETEIKAKVCQPCWKKWEAMRVMVINEYQVNLGDESGRELVKKQMKAFLKLGEQTDTSKLDQNYRPQAGT